LRQPLPRPLRYWFADISCHSTKVDRRKHHPISSFLQLRKISTFAAIPFVPNAGPKQIGREMLCNDLLSASLRSNTKKAIFWQKFSLVSGILCRALSLKNRRGAKSAGK
ncbi:MAG: hypothetical protein LBR39_03510, partial [Coriobacteriales bacterium]|nr:hypothetical protein [Coriobacteriales bacterium]